MSHTYLSQLLEYWDLAGNFHEVRLVREREKQRGRERERERRRDNGGSGGRGRKGLGKQASKRAS